MITVREATIQDLQAMFRLVSKMLMESPQYNDQIPSDIDIVVNLERYIEDTHRCAFIAVEGNDLIGLMLGYTYLPEMFKERTAADTLLYVEPLYRLEGVGQKLLRAYSDWASQDTGGRIYFGTTTQVNSEGAIKMAQHEGYEIVGTIMRKV